MADRARGTFQVKVVPAASGDADSVASGRLTIRKTFEGDLTGESRGEMWTVETRAEGSAGYVAIERIRGKLSGRDGTFVVLHQGTMRRGGDFQLRLAVVPDSGTEQLEGLSGSMTIVIADGVHSYELEYTLPEAAPRP